MAYVLIVWCKIVMIPFYVCCVEILKVLVGSCDVVIKYLMFHERLDIALQWQYAVGQYSMWSNGLEDIYQSFRLARES